MKIIQQNKTTITVLIIIIGGILFLNSKKTDETPHIVVESSSVYQMDKIYVHITGQVEKPGVYSVDYKTRVFELIELAGGLEKDAYVDNLNMVSELKDGQKLHIYTVEEWNIKQVADENAGMVNINTANVERLMTLPGVGEARAKAIIAYRENNGEFQCIEDIMKVTGIKEAAFAKIRDLICV